MSSIRDWTDGDWEGWSIELNPAFAEAWNNLGVVLGESHELDAAESALRKAIRLGFGDAEFNLAHVLERDRRIGEAREHWATFAMAAAHTARGEYARRRAN